MWLYLQLILQQVFLIGEFAIESEQALLICRQFLRNGLAPTPSAGWQCVRTPMSILFFWCGFMVAISPCVYLFCFNFENSVS